MQFAMFLVENGVITYEEFFEAIKLQMATRPQLGTLAIESRLLTFRQVFSILRAQCDEPNVMFGEVAVRLGYLSEDDVARLLAEQVGRAHPMLDVLIENDFLTTEEAERQYAQFRRSMESSSAPLAATGSAT